MNTRNNQTAREYHSDLLDNLLAQISPEEQVKIDKRMLLAASIDQARIQKGWSRKELAAQMGKRPSEITKWLSGTHNFTADTLFDLEAKLDIRLLNVEEQPKEQIVRYLYTVETQVHAVAEPCPTYYTPVSAYIVPSPTKNPASC